MIPYENLRLVNEPYFAALQGAFGRTLESGWYVLGREVAAFEEEFAAWCGSRYGIGVASGLDALTLSLVSLELPPGSEVLVPSNTYIATILAIVHAGHRPVLVEPDPATYNMDPARIEAAITDATRAIMVVHLYGKPSAMGPICALAERHGLRIVEDCAQAHGATWQGRTVGTFGACGAFSFYPTKNLGALGDAGLVTTDDPALAERLRKLRNYGSGVKYHNELVGWNSRLDEVQAAFLRVKLADLDRITGHKRQLARLYREGLKGEFILSVEEAGVEDVYHIFNVRHPERDRLKAYLLERGIGTEIHYPVPPHRQPAMAGILPPKGFPLADEIHATTLSLPISLCHSEADIRQVIQAMNSF